MKNKIIVYMAIALLAISSGCRKKDPAAMDTSGGAISGPCRVKEMQIVDIGQYVFFNYDINGRLVSVGDSSFDQPLTVYPVIYTHGKMTQIGTPVPMCSFKYNTDGSMSDMYYRSRHCHFNYNAKKQIARVDYREIIDDSLFSWYKLSYDSAGNITRADLIAKDGTLDSYQFYFYGNKNNPFLGGRNDVALIAGTYDINYPITNFEYWGVNNCIRSGVNSGSGGSFGFTYTYTCNGYEYPLQFTSSEYNQVVNKYFYTCF